MVASSRWEIRWPSLWRERLVRRWKGLSDEETLEERCNAMLDGSDWEQATWSKEQWETLRVMVEMAGDATQRVCAL